MACQGIYADVQYTNNTYSQVQEDLAKIGILQEEYDRYKETFAKNLILKHDDYPETWSTLVVPYRPLEVVQIYFDTSTYDQNEKDVKVTLEGQLGVVGGTMGLFAGFSLLSGVEIVYFVLKFVISTLVKIRENIMHS